MPALPAAYQWVTTLNPLPRMVSEALALFGTVEAPGDAQNNPVIMRWAAEVSETLKHDYYADSVPWCGLFMAIVSKRAGKTPPAPLAGNVPP